MDYKDQNIVIKIFFLQTAMKGAVGYYIPSSNMSGIMLIGCKCSQTRQESFRGLFKKGKELLVQNEARLDVVREWERKGDNQPRWVEVGRSGEQDGYPQGTVRGHMDGIQGCKVASGKG